MTVLVFCSNLWARKFPQYISSGTSCLCLLVELPSPLPPFPEHKVASNSTTHYIQRKYKCRGQPLVGWGAHAAQFTVQKYTMCTHFCVMYVFYLQFHEEQLRTRRHENCWQSTYPSPSVFSFLCDHFIEAGFCLFILLDASQAYYRL